MNPEISGMGSLSRLLQASSLRHRVIAQNVANVNTPGYHRLEVRFNDNLAKAVSGDLSAPQVVVADGPERVDGNTVDIDQEMNDLSKNALLYQAAAQILASRMASMRSAITGR